MTDSPSITVRNLTKVYHLYDRPMDRVKEALHPFRRQYHHDFPALQDVSFEIRRGQTVAVIGRNGSGKSTLLKLITGVLTPTSGSVAVKGRISALLELGAGFNPELTGIQNIFLYGSVIGYAREEMKRRLDDIIAFAEIGEFVEQPVKLYSTGMFARLAFATYIHVDPDILIVDEVLAVGDIRFQLKCRDKLQELRDRGTTILYVTHGNQGLGDWAIMLEQGRVEKTGSLLDVWNHYHRLMTDGVERPAAVLEASAQASDPQAPEPAASAEDSAGSEIHVSDSCSRDEEEIRSRLRFHESQEFQKRVENVRFGTSEVRFVYTELLNDRLARVGTVTLGDVVYYRLHMRVDEDVPFLAAGIQIRNDAGLYLLGEESWARRVPMMDLHARDTIVLEFRIEVNFYPGEYTITPGCSYRNVELPGEATYYDWIDNCDVLTVTSNKKPVYSMYYVPLETVVRIDRHSGKAPRNATELKHRYEERSRSST